MTHPDVKSVSVIVRVKNKSRVNIDLSGLDKRNGCKSVQVWKIRTTVVMM